MGWTSSHLYFACLALGYTTLVHVGPVQAQTPGSPFGGTQAQVLLDVGAAIKSVPSAQPKNARLTRPEADYVLAASQLDEKLKAFNSLPCPGGKSDESADSSLIIHKLYVLTDEELLAAKGSMGSRDYAAQFALAMSKISPQDRLRVKGVAKFQNLLAEFKKAYPQVLSANLGIEALANALHVFLREKFAVNVPRATLVREIAMTRLRQNPSAWRRVLVESAPLLKSEEARLDLAKVVGAKQGQGLKTKAWLALEADALAALGFQAQPVEVAGLGQVLKVSDKSAGGRLQGAEEFFIGPPASAPRVRALRSTGKMSDGTPVEMVGGRTSRGTPIAAVITRGKPTGAAAARVATGSREGPATGPEGKPAGGTVEEITFVGNGEVAINIDGGGHSTVRREAIPQGQQKVAVKDGKNVKVTSIETVEFLGFERDVISGRERKIEIRPPDPGSTEPSFRIAMGKRVTGQEIVSEAQGGGVVTTKVENLKLQFEVTAMNKSIIGGATPVNARGGTVSSRVEGNLGKGRMVGVNPRFERENVAGEATVRRAMAAVDIVGKPTKSSLIGVTRADTNLSGDDKMQTTEWVLRGEVDVPRPDGDGRIQAVAFVAAVDRSSGGSEKRIGGVLSLPPQKEKGGAWGARIEHRIGDGVDGENETAGSIRYTVPLN